MNEPVTCENVKTMVNWLKEGEVNPKVCKPCAVALLTGDYKAVLEDAGQTDKVAYWTLCWSPLRARTSLECGGRYG